MRQSPWRQDLWSHLPWCQGLRSYIHRTPGQLRIHGERMWTLCHVMPTPMFLWCSMERYCMERVKSPRTSTNLNHLSKDVQGLAFCDFRVPVSNHTRRGSFWPALKSVSTEYIWIINLARITLSILDLWWLTDLCRQNGLLSSVQHSSTGNPLGLLLGVKAMFSRRCNTSMEFLSTSEETSTQAQRTSSKRSSTYCNATQHCVTWSTSSMRQY